ncbi:MAG: hypothetical protein KDA85_12410 [Planctomycetaceae bacterium]|nr:hypothetical protein [Planctomycetaceae bacterium]
MSANQTESGESPAAHSGVSLKSIAIVTLLSLMQMIVLFGLQLILAAAFGASETLDNFLSASTIPLVVSGVLTGVIGPPLLRLYNERLAAESAEAAGSLMTGLGCLLGVVSFALGGLTVLCAPWLVTCFFRDLQGESLIETVALLRIQAWLIPLNTLIGFLHAAMHAQQRFLTPAIGGVVGPAATVAAFLLCENQTTTALAWSGVFGAMTGILLLVFQTPLPARNSLTEAWQQRYHFLQLACPLLLSAAYARLDTLVDRPLADSLAEGSISQMNYALRITMAVATLTTSGLAVVIFPALARQAALADMRRLCQQLNEGWRFLLVVLIPVILGIIACGQSIIACLFVRGQFTSADGHQVAWLLTLSCGLIAGAAIGELSGRTFYAIGRNWVPTAIGLMGFTLGTTAKFLVVTKWQTAGLVVCTSAYYLLNAVTFLLALHWAGIRIERRPLLITLLRSGGAAGIAVTVAWLLMGPASAARVASGLVSAVAIYLLLLWATGDEFVIRLQRSLSQVRPSGNE